LGIDEGTKDVCGIYITYSVGLSLFIDSKDRAQYQTGLYKWYVAGVYWEMSTVS